MSSGACRALVALLLTLVAASVMAMPVVAKNDQLLETATVTYKVKPSRGVIDARVSVVLRPRNQVWPKQPWSQVVLEENASKLNASGAFAIGSRRDLPGLWEAVDIRTPRINQGDIGKTIVSYRLNASVTADNTVKRTMPARLDDSYMYFCITGQDTHTGSVAVEFESGVTNRWKLTQHGTPMEPTNSGFASTEADRRSPGEIFTCFEGVREERLQTDVLIGPADREIELQAWAQLGSWLPIAKSTAPPVLRDLHAFLGYDIPGEGPVIVRMAPTRELGGYAGSHSTPGVVQLDEFPTDPTHQLAHAWFGTDNFQNVWLREGMAEWTATAMRGEACAPATENPLELELADATWLVVQPQSPDDIEERIAAQEAAACGIVSAVAARMPQNRWRDVIGSMLLGETKYIGSAGPEIGSSTGVDWREWLDAVDERGLVPAAANPAYAANLDDLDFAQDLLDSFGIAEVLPGGLTELPLRSEARADYHAFLNEIAPLGAPWAVRQDMDDWEFRTAMARIAKSREVYAQLTEADDLLPEADLVRIVQPQFEAARSEAELDDVAEIVRTLLEGTQGVVGPLGDLNDALPAGWTVPAAVNRAISEQRFGDIMAAISPAIVAAQEISAAHAALPQAGLLDKYKARYETTTSAARLDDLASDAADDKRNAQRAGGALESLETEIGEWSIPAAVTDPLLAGQLQAGYAIIEDARAVVRAATAADLALPAAGMREDVQPQFEAVRTGAEMTALREQVEARAAEAEAVGNALSTLNTLVPGWQIPAVVADPVAAGDFAAARATAEAAETWVTAANEADLALPEIDAMNRIKEGFESAASLAELQAGVTLAQEWAEAASHVRRAIDENSKDRDLLTSFGLWGVDVTPIVEQAKAAAIEGNVKEAIQLSGDAIHTLQGGSSAGSLRLIGIVFFGVAVLGVLGLWVMLRRQAGPSWARSTKPHWVEGGEGKRGLLGRGKKK